MHHIFLGISPVELGGAPFALATDAALDLAADLYGCVQSGLRDLSRNKKHLKGFGR